MLKLGLKGVAGILLFIFCQLLYAQPEFITPTHTILTSSFDAQKANRTLDKLSIQLSIVNVNVQNLEEAVHILSSLHEEARQCVTQSTQQTEKLSDLWKNTVAGTQEAGVLTPLQQYLKNKQEEINTQRSACQLFALRSDEAIKAFSATIKKMSARQLLSTRPGFWPTLSVGLKGLRQLPSEFKYKSFLAQIGSEIFTKTHIIILGGISLILGLLVSLLGYRASKKSLSSLKLVETFSDKLKLALLKTCKKYIIPAMLAAVILMNMTLIVYIGEWQSTLLPASFAALSYVLLLALTYFFFFPFRNLQPMSDITESITRPLLLRLKLLFSFLFISFLIYQLLHEQPISAPAFSLLRTTFITLLIVSLINILWLINRIPKLLNQHRIFRITISFLLSTAFITLVAAEWLGYQQLVSYLLRGLTLTLLYGFIAWVLHKVVLGTIHAATRSGAPLAEAFRHQLGVRRYENISELLWLHVLFYITIWGGFALAILKAWNLSDTHFQNLLVALTDGFQLTGMHIAPAKIFGALLFAVITFLFIRWIRQLIENRKEETINVGAQQAFAAIVAYVAIAATILITLLIAGVNFAGLAIIAGALSVGIGFGLQNIVNNFLSGIILLLERPIKPGDRVSINGIEGYVKKIHLRYTQIRTLEFSDLIVPNAEIISKQVTNMMFQDVTGRVYTTVGVAYGSDTELVTRLLKEIIEAHPEIIKDDPIRQSSIIFSEFSSSSLKFDIYCIIRNINLKYIVLSELNMAINKVFNANNITIAFPQQDLHIKEWPSKPN